MAERILVVAPHPDDEVLGAGGAIARLSSEGAEVHILVVTRGMPPLYTAADVERSRREAGEAHRILGVRETRFLDFPAAGLDTVAHGEVNAAIGEVGEELEPDAVFIPFAGDLHLDHQRTFLSALVASRPHRGRPPKTVYCYETLSETNWNAPYLTPGFAPNVFMDITKHLERKIEALKAYASQVKPFPHERSVEAVRALAQLRGSTVGLAAAEAFVLVREVL